MNTSNLNKLLVIGEKMGLCLFMSYSLNNEILQTGRKERRVDVHPGLGGNLNRYSDPTGVCHPPCHFYSMKESETYLHLHLQK